MAANVTSPEALSRNVGSAMPILSSLASGEKLVYALVKDVRSPADTVISLRTNYETLARLETQILIDTVENNDRRRPSRLMALGMSVLTERPQAHRRLADVGIRRLHYASSVA